MWPFDTVYGRRSQATREVTGKRRPPIMLGMHVSGAARRRWMLKPTSPADLARATHAQTGVRHVPAYGPRGGRVRAHDPGDAPPHVNKLDSVPSVAAVGHRLTQLAESGAACAGASRGAENAPRQLAPGVITRDWPPAGESFLMRGAGRTDAE